MNCTKEQISIWINDYRKQIGNSVNNRKWEKKYVYLHAPRNNSEDCYHKWLDWVDSNFEMLKKLPTFEDIHNALNAKTMKGIGPLTKYDTATQIAFPDKKYPSLVYLHAGAAKGAKGIDVFESKVDKHVFVDICSDFEKLNTAQIEDFLCIYKSHLNGEVNNIKSNKGCAKQKKKRYCA